MQARKTLKILLFMLCAAGLFVLLMLGVAAEEATFYVGDAVHLTLPIGEDGALTLPDAPETGDKIFVGWMQGTGEHLGLYAPGTELSVEGRASFSFRAFCVSLETMNGAAISKSAPLSLRFDAYLPAAELARLQEHVGAENVTVGLLTAPRTSLIGVGRNFNHTDGAGFVTVHTPSAPSYLVGDVALFSARVGGIAPEGLLDRYAARAFLTVRFASGESRTVYAPFRLADHVRSAHAVLAAAYEDRAAATDATHTVAVDYEGVVTYSPYSDEVRACFRGQLDRAVHIQTPVLAGEQTRIESSYSIDGVEFLSFFYYRSPYRVQSAEVDDKYRTVVVVGEGTADFHNIATYYLGGSYSVYLLDKCEMTAEGFVVKQSIQTALPR